MGEIENFFPNNRGRFNYVGPVLTFSIWYLGIMVRRVTNGLVGNRLFMAVEDGVYPTSQREVRGKISIQDLFVKGCSEAEQPFLM